MKGDRIKKTAMGKIFLILADLQKRGGHNRVHPEEERVLKEARDFVDFVFNSFGNQCAWTDRCCENVVSLGEGLKLENLNDVEGIEPNVQEQFDYWIKRLKGVI